MRSGWNTNQAVLTLAIGGERWVEFIRRGAMLTLACTVHTSLDPRNLFYGVAKQKYISKMT